jgi:hypothetical protein
LASGFLWAGLGGWQTGAQRKERTGAMKMRRLDGLAATLMTSLGLALLAASVALVPQGAAWGQDEVPNSTLGPPCSGDVCSNKCIDPTECEINASQSACVKRLGAVFGCGCNALSSGCSGCKCEIHTSIRDGSKSCKCK